MTGKHVAGSQGSGTSVSARQPITVTSDYTADNLDDQLTCVGALTVTLAKNPAVSQRITVIADTSGGGDVLVQGGTHPILSGSTTVLDRTSTTFYFDSSGHWVAEVSSSTDPKTTLVEVTDDQTVTVVEGWKDLLTINFNPGTLMRTLEIEAAFSSRNSGATLNAPATNQFRIEATIPVFGPAVGNAAATSLHGATDTESGALLEQITSTGPGTYTIKLQWKTDVDAGEISKASLPDFCSAALRVTESFR